MTERIIIGATERELAEKRIYLDLEKGSILSQSGLFYWFKEQLTGASIYIYKNSPQGREMKKFLAYKRNQDNKSLNRKALSLLHTELSWREFRELLNIDSKDELEIRYSDLKWWRNLHLTEYEEANRRMRKERNKLTFDQYLELHSRREWLYKELKTVDIKIDSLEFLMSFIK